MLEVGLIGANSSRFEFYLSLWWHCHFCLVWAMFVLSSEEDICPGGVSVLVVLFFVSLLPGPRTLRALISRDFCSSCTLFLVDQFL